MFCLKSNAGEKMFFVYKQQSHSSVKQLLLLIIYTVIALQRHCHGTWLYYVSCYTNIDEKDDCYSSPYGKYAKLPKITMICLWQAGKGPGLIQTKMPNCTIKIICGKEEGNKTRKECTGLTSHLFTVKIIEWSL